MTTDQFQKEWIKSNSKNGIKKELDDQLRHMRSYVVNKFKETFSGEFCPPLSSLVLFFSQMPRILVSKEWLECQQRDVDEEANAAADEKRWANTPTRLTFLHFGNNRSVRDSKGNLRLKDAMTSTDGNAAVEDWMRVETREEWRDFPEIVEPAVAPEQLFQDESSITNADGPLALMAWILDLFGPDILSSKWDRHCNSCRDKKELIDPGSMVDLVTRDDLVYIFVQLQNNINRWILHYRAWRLKKGPSCWEGTPNFASAQFTKKGLLEDDKTRLDFFDELGTEYPGGSGVSGKAGKLRYAAMTIFFHKAYFEKDSNGHHTVHAQRNRDALKNKLREMRDQGKSHRTVNCPMENEENVASQDDARRKKNSNIHGGLSHSEMTELCNIQEEEWSVESIGVVGV